jgi:hypothetical protein
MLSKVQIGWVLLTPDLKKILAPGNVLEPTSKISLDHIFWDESIAQSRNKFLHGRLILKEIKVTLEVTE